MVLRNRLTGICGSDSKQVLMDFERRRRQPHDRVHLLPPGARPRGGGHGRRAGPAVDDLESASGSVLNPWLSCAPRGIDPLCPACEAGDYSICWNFHEGRLSPGIHTGNAVEATGGFAELLPAHRSMAFAVPDDIADEVAVLADPWSVSFHAITRNPPPPGGKVVVYGAGALGTTATAILRQLYPDVEVATVARWPAQARWPGARRDGVRARARPRR